MYVYGINIIIAYCLHIKSNQLLYYNIVQYNTTMYNFYRLYIEKYAFSSYYIYKTDVLLQNKNASSGDKCLLLFQNCTDCILILCICIQKQNQLSTCFLFFIGKYNTNLRYIYFF